MAKLQEFNGRYCESEFECAFLAFLETEDWTYTSGNDVNRITKRDILITDDFKTFIKENNPDLTEEETAESSTAILQLVAFAGKDTVSSERLSAKV